MAKWLLVDGFNLAYRCFFAIPELSRADGFPTNALHGWVKSLWRLSDQEKPDGSLVFFDLGGAEDRLALHPEYKAHREEMPEPLSRQIPIIKELTRAMGLWGIEVHGVESDDLLASHAWALAKKGDDVLIVKLGQGLCADRRGKDQDHAASPDRESQAGMADPGRGRRRGKIRSPALPDRRLPGAGGRHLGQHPGAGGGGAEDGLKMAGRTRQPRGVIAAGDRIAPERFRLPLAAAADRLRMNLRITTLNLALPPPNPEHSVARPDELFSILERMEMKSALADAQKRYGEPELF